MMPWLEGGAAVAVRLLVKVLFGLLRSTASALRSWSVGVSSVPAGRRDVRTEDIYWTQLYMSFTHTLCASVCVCRNEECARERVSEGTRLCACAFALTCVSVSVQHLTISKVSIRQGDKKSGVSRLGGDAGLG